MMSRMWMRETMALVGLIALGCLTGACKEKTPCDDGQAFRDGYCWDVDAAVPSNDATASAGGETSGGEAGQPGGAAAFGRTCATDGDCASPASLCAPQLYYCTVLGCDADATLCPVGWTCLDVSMWAGYDSHMCFKGF